MREKGPKNYRFGSGETSMVLTMQHGSSKQDFRLEFISNGAIRTAEFDRWVQSMHKAGKELPDMRVVDRKLRDKEAMLNYKMSKEEIDQVVAENLRKLKKPLNITGEKAHLRTMLQIAISNQQRDEIQRLTEEIEKLEEIEREQQPQQSVDKVALINIKHRAINLEEQARRALGNQDFSRRTNDPFQRRMARTTLFYSEAEEAAAANQQQANQQQSPQTTHQPGKKWEDRVLASSTDSLGEDGFDDGLNISLDIDVDKSKSMCF